MKRFETVLLAGPDVFLPDGRTLRGRMRRLVAAAGLTALEAEAAEGAGGASHEARARELYAECLARVRAADAVIANFTPWRGAGPCAATAFIAGFAAALDKPLFAYVNVADEEEAELLGRVARFSGASRGPDGVWRDDLGAEVENFGLPETYMLWAEARRFFVVVSPEPYADVAGVELCLEALRLYAG